MFEASGRGVPAALAQTTSPVSASTTSRPAGRAAALRAARPHLVAGAGSPGAARGQQEKAAEQAAKRQERRLRFIVS